MSGGAPALDRLRDVLVYGIVADIYLAERARELHRNAPIATVRAERPRGLLGQLPDSSAEAP